MAELRVAIGHALTKCQQERGRGGPGGWVWVAYCQCGWHSWKRKIEDQARHDFDTHVQEEPGAMVIYNHHYWTSIFETTYRNVYLMGMR